VLYGTELGNAGNTVRNEMCYMAQSYEMQGTLYEIKCVVWHRVMKCREHCEK